MYNVPISDLFRVRDRFLRSAHLERDFNDPKALSGYILTQQVRSHAERLASGLRSNSGQRAWRITGDYGSGKSSFALFLAHILSGQRSQLPPTIRDTIDFKKLGIRVPRMLPVLVTGSVEPLSVALLRSLRRDLVDVAGFKRNARIVQLIDEALSNHDQSPIPDATVVELVSDACAQVIQSQRGTGILILLDELGKFLEYGAFHPEQQDVFLLQRIAETACRSSNHPLLVVGLLHQGFNAYSANLSLSAQKEWQKVAGRFDELLFNQPMEHTALLIGDALNIKPGALPKNIASSGRSDMARLLELGWYGSSYSRNGLLETAPRLYPLHPATVPSLLRLFTRFGQNERSLFSFLLSNEPYGLQEFSSKAVGVDHFYRLHDLYDYARYSLGDKIGRESFRTHWNHIDSMIESFPTDNQLGLQILKTVGLLNLLDTPALLASEQAIALSVGRSLPEVQIGIRQLTSKGILYYRGAAGGFCLWPHTSVNLEKAYQDATRELGQMSAQVSTLLTKYLETRPLVARRHYIETGSLRHFDVQYCSPEELSKHRHVDYRKADGKIVVVLCESESDRAKALQTSNSDELKQAELTLCVIPRPLRVLGGLLQEVQRWEWVQANVPELANDNFAFEEVSRQLSTAADALQTRLKSILGLQHFHADTAPTFVRAGNKISISSGRELLSYLSTTCDEVYDESPKITNELINRRLLSSAAAAARGKLIQAVFTGAAQPFLGMDKDKKPPEMSMYLSVLQAAHLHRETKDRFTLALPRHGHDPCNVLPSMHEIQRLLDESNTKRVRVSTILDGLREPPFGIRDGLGPLLLSTFAVLNEQHIAFYDDGRFMRQVLGLDLLRLFKLPEQFEIQYCKMSGVRISLFERLMSVLALTTANSGKPDVLDVVRPLCVFAAQLPSYTQKTNDLLTTTLAVRNVLLNAREPAALLFKELPEACGFGDFTKDGKSHRDIDLFVASLKSSIEELRAAYPNLRERIRRELLDSLEINENNPKFRELLSERANSVLLSVTEPRLKAFCFRLSDRELGLPEWLDSLGSMVCSVPPNRWSDTDVLRFSQELVLICCQFRRVEKLAFGTRGGEDYTASLRLAITQLTGTETDRIVHIRKEDESLIDDLEKQIMETIRTAPHAGLAAATRALWKLLGEGQTL